MITRVTEQKGFDILLPALESILPNFDIKVIILGLGDKTYEQKTKNLEQKFPKKLKFLDRFDDDIAHLIYAGSDFLLVPSRFEPCGLTQLIAMRYGTLPLVRKTGGLANSVEEGVTGFMFGDYAAKALRDKMEEAISVFQVSQIAMEKMINHAMRKDFSWEKTAGEYVALYNQLSAV
jgi:starch synthase